ncbi:lipoprotein LpqH [Mycolicibacterium baixiangningiae]|uniref:lipoprotein LpqH n=1 Tax=Mycolicibacterium baixiangningiae TaxID=2761578 RepID=UPI001E2A1548|nr:lipoprotein LpqH [Mycolicibacterium baixiangningiae]
MGARSGHSAAAIVVLVIAGATGCGDSKQTTPHAWATVAINDVAIEAAVPRCTRMASYLTLRMDVQQGEVTGVLDLTAERPVAKWVKIRDAGGFTGDFWQGGVGSADAVRTAAGYALTGSAYGVYTSRPSELGATATFRIQTTC